MTPQPPPPVSRHVVAGGAPLVEVLPGGVELTTFAVGEMDNDVYLLEPPGGPCVLIDAAADAERILAVIGKRPVATVVTTHRHHDHVGALAEVVAATGAEPVAGTPDVAAIAEQSGVQSRGVWTGDRLALGEGALDVIGLVGHTPGAIALAWTRDGLTHLFTGDSLFPGGVGKTPDAASFTRLLDDVERELFDRFGDDTVVHPGHGDATTLGHERPALGSWRARGW